MRFGDDERPGRALLRSWRGPRCSDGPGVGSVSAVLLAEPDRRGERVDQSDAAVDVKSVASTVGDRPDPVRTWMAGVTREAEALPAGDLHVDDSGMRCPHPQLEHAAFCPAEPEMCSAAGGIV